MTSLEHFDNPNRTMAEIAKITTEGHKDSREARQQAENSLLNLAWLAVGSLRGRAPGQDKIAQGEKAFEKFEELIIDEAERYLEVYEEYAKRVQGFASLLGIPIEPRKISDFIDFIGNADPPSLLPDSRNTEADLLERALLEEVFTKIVPIRTSFDLEGKQIVSQELARTLREELLTDFETAYEKAKSQGQEYLLRVSSYISLATESPGVISGHGDWHKIGYFAPPKEFDKYDTRDYPNNQYEPAFAKFTEKIKVEEREEERTTSYAMRYKVQKIPLEQARKEANPISITLKVGGEELKIASPDVDTVLRNVFARFDLARAKNILATIDALKAANIAFPNGRVIAVLDLTPEMFDDSARMPKKQS